MFSPPTYSIDHEDEGKTRSRYEVKATANEISAPKKVERIKKLVKPKWILNAKMIINILVMITSYSLLFTDIIRTGPTVDLSKEKELRSGIFASFGPYIYPVCNIKRMSESYVATKREEKMTTIPLWGYKYDTTSSGIRALSAFMKSKSMPQCVLYNGTCDFPVGVPPKTIFNILNELVEKLIAYRVKLSGTSDRPYPVVHHEGGATSRTLFTGTIRHLFLDFPSDIFAQLFFGRNTQGIMRVTHFNLSSSIKLCDGSQNDLMICNVDEAELRRSSGYSSYQEMKYAFFQLEKRIENLVNETRDPGLVADVTFLENNHIPLKRVGGIILARTNSFESVMISRVRKCVGGKCTTISVDDYRYEGSIIVSDVRDWDTILSIFRNFSQVYFYFRVFCLYAALYMTDMVDEKGNPPKSSMDRIKWAFQLSCYIPTQCIVYGTVVPVLFYAFSYFTDATIMHIIAASRLYALQGEQFILWEAIPVISKLMRNIWPMAFLALLFVFFQSPSPTTPKFKVISLRGRIIPIFSYFSIYLRYKNKSFRDTRIVQFAETIPWIKGEVEHFLSTKATRYGIYLDFQNVLIIAVIYATLYHIFTAIFNLIFFHRKKKDNLTGAFFTTTTVSSVCTVLWPPYCLCIGWRRALLSPNSKVNEDIGDRDHILMNIAFLSDPFNYYIMRNSRRSIYKFESSKGTIHYHSHAVLGDDTGEGLTFKLVEKLDVSTQKWDDLILYK